MSAVPNAAFKGFRFPPEIIVLAVRWYLRYGLSSRDLEELLAERVGAEKLVRASRAGTSRRFARRDRIRRDVLLTVLVPETRSGRSADVLEVGVGCVIGGRARRS
jgi:transposase-like protein